MRIDSLALKPAKLTLKAVLLMLGAVAGVLAGLRNTVEEYKLRLLIRLNRKKKPLDQQVLDIYWDADFAEAAEHWGETSTWAELEYFLVNCHGRVLDVACGSGRTMQLMQKFSSCELHGCDISGALIDLAIKKRGMEASRFTECNAVAMPYPDEWFNYAYSVGSLEHFTEKGITQVLTECYRTTRYATFHHVPASKRGRDEGWIVTDQGYFLNSAEWWLRKCSEVYDTVQVLRSSWHDPLSVGIWLVCNKEQPRP